MSLLTTSIALGPGMLLPVIMNGEGMEEEWFDNLKHNLSAQTPM